MKKYRFLKKFNRYSANEVVELSDIQASNCFRRGVIEEYKEKKAKTPALDQFKKIEKVDVENKLEKPKRKKTK